MRRAREPVGELSSIRQNRLARHSGRPGPGRRVSAAAAAHAPHAGLAFDVLERQRAAHAPRDLLHERQLQFTDATEFA